MTTTSSERRSTEISEEVVQESTTAMASDLVAPVDRREQVKVVRDAGGERRERVVEDVGAERQSYLHKAGQLIWLGAFVLEMLIGLRFVLKLIAANPANPFARLVYGFTDLFLGPFQNLTVTPAAENGMTLELHALIAMAVYAMLAWIAVKILYLIFTPSRSRTVSVYQRDDR